MAHTIKWVGEDKMIEFDGRLFAFSDEAAEQLTGSIVRSYAVRRWFNAALHRAVVRMTAGDGV